jgi:hypothetical protein
MYDDSCCEEDEKNLNGGGYIKANHGWDHDGDEWTEEEEFDYQNYKKFYRELPKFDFWYLITGRAFLRIVQAVSSLIAFCFVAWVNAYFLPTYVVQATLLSAFGGSSFFLAVYSANIIRSTKLRWIFHELIFTGLAVYMIGISTLIMGYSAIRWQYSSWIISVIFCVFSFITFLSDFISLISMHRKQPDCRHHDAKRIRDLSPSSIHSESIPVEDPY